MDLILKIFKEGSDLWRNICIVIAYLDLQDDHSNEISKYEPGRIDSNIEIVI